MSTDNKSATAGGPTNRDVLGVGSSSGAGAARENTEIDYSVIGATCFSTMGMATMMSTRTFDAKFAKVAAVVGANSAADRRELQVLLAYYFSVHGTSPDTAWAEYDKPFVRGTTSYNPNLIVKEIGEGSLKQFCARFSGHVLQLFKESKDYRAALSERASRFGVDPNDALFVVDFYGKDGSLDSASMGTKAEVRSRALQYRANNAVGVMSQSRGQAADQRLSTPAVVPENLHRSFRN